MAINRKSGFQYGRPVSLNLSQAQFHVLRDKSAMQNHARIVPG